MIIATGVDIVKVERFKKLADKHNFMCKVFSLQEREYLKDKSIESLAGLFAVKEAAVKAMGTGFRGFSPCDIEVTHDILGKPCITLHGNAKTTLKSTLKNLVRDNRGAKKFRRLHFHVSISHTSTDAIAFVVLSL